jgi:hypothetical protein
MDTDNKSKVINAFLAMMETHFLTAENQLEEHQIKKEWILNRIQTHITNMPALLDAEYKKHEERVTRMNELTAEHDNFHKVFLSKHQYYYMPYNNLYYEYDGKTYQIVKDDDIHHRLLSTITDEGKLISWKHKTKLNMIRTIKERTLLKSVPETYTIQTVLGFLNTIFETKSETKYFLTVIGDCILKKNINGLMFFVNSNTKKLVSFIDSIAYITTGNTIINNFISKHHESHNLTSYRLIKTNNNAISSEILKTILNKIGIDLLCVATHYSDRYLSSDNYLNMNLSVESDTTLYFTKNSINAIIDTFLVQCIESVTTNELLGTETKYNLTWKNMHYIWKQYLSAINVPNMIYTNNLKTLLKTHLSFVETNSLDITFTNVTSKFLPAVSSFLSFWESHITIIGSETKNDLITVDLNSSAFDDEYEIDEIVSMYKNYLKANDANCNSNACSDDEIIKIIIHYFSPSVEVIERKYITNIKCNMWSKQDDIRKMLDEYKKTQIQNQNQNHVLEELISFDDLYHAYRSYCRATVIVEKTVCLIVSKQFFEKYLLYFLHDYVKFDKFIGIEWFQ